MPCCTHNKSCFYSFVDFLKRNTDAARFWSHYFFLQQQHSYNDIDDNSKFHLSNFRTVSKPHPTHEFVVLFLIGSTSLTIYVHIFCSIDRTMKWVAPSCNKHRLNPLKSLIVSLRFELLHSKDYHSGDLRYFYFILGTLNFLDSASDWFES